MSYIGFPVSGVDRAIGTNGLPGTPTPSNKRLISGNVSFGQFFFQEMPNSPTIERGEQATIVHKFQCDYITGQTYLLGLARGQLMVDTQGNMSRILSTTLDHDKGDICVLSITAEGVAGLNPNLSISLFNVPPDDFSVDTVEFNPSIFRHPRYQQVLDFNLDADGNILDNGFPTGPQIIQWIQGAVNLATNGSQQDMANQINSTNIPDDTLELALELLSKVRQGTETFYLAGFKGDVQQLLVLSRSNESGWVYRRPGYIWKSSNLLLERRSKRQCKHQYFYNLCRHGCASFLCQWNFMVASGGYSIIPAHVVQVDIHMDWTAFRLVGCSDLRASTIASCHWIIWMYPFHATVSYHRQSFPGLHRSVSRIRCHTFINSRGKVRISITSSPTSLDSLRVV